MENTNAFMTLSNRKTIFFGFVSYTYANVMHPPLRVPGFLLGLLTQANELFKCNCNSVLVNAYRCQSDYVGFHADDEPSIVNGSTIVSISIGEERLFLFKRNIDGEIRKVLLPSGSILVMTGNLQSEWTHSLPKCPHPCGKRFNITFRELL